MPAETTENAETATAQHPEKRKEQQQPETTYYEGILYHGAPRAFQFRVDYRFDDPQADGSATLGLGLYTSDEADVAVNYSEVRSGRDNPPHVYSLCAPDAKFLDFRGEAGNNVPVTREMLIKWTEYFSKQLSREIAEKPDLGPAEIVEDVPGKDYRRLKINYDLIWRALKQQYLAFLYELPEREAVDLRVMLGTGPTGPNRADFRRFPSGSPPWVHYFRRFVLDELQYDGIIYIEGGEGKKAKEHNTFVIYNLDKVFFSKEWLPVGVLEELTGK